MPSIGSLENSRNWRCDDCGRKPPRFWTARCVCGQLWMECPRCVTKAEMATKLEKHEQTCRTASVAPAPGLEGAGPAPGYNHVASRRTLMRAGARAGATFAKVRGPKHAAVGGLLGAALGALGSHVLNHKHVRPIVEKVAELREPALDVWEIARAVVKK